eukprot:Protomagalhaensia_wolfi_Nauph_80__132@NODE_1075_length_1756_cov_128_585906_g817_i0_p1_GENE_NODE_1075_length_1756_cov_128_585906_g817_i0NODE_1075_length_1756_cov_128_585906_g817_i0_p1_ORF_typecomplete_len225_score48_06Gpr1_Fun34_YaaH/PF01184_19/1_2e33_NODE_1075_length_1756_cov_128_585906_g817_i09621636
MKRYIADPAPLGFYAFAIQTFYAGTVYADWITAKAAVAFAPAIWYGGAAQLITGVIQLLRGEKVAGTIFAAFGLNWIATGYLLEPGMDQSLLTHYNGGGEMGRQLGVYYLCWFCFACAYLGVNIRSNVVLVLLCILVCCNFLLLTIGQLGEISMALTIAGYTMISTGVVAFYLGTAALWSGNGPVELPLWPIRAAPRAQAQHPNGGGGPKYYTEPGTAATDDKP